jgi:metal-responsive CopG/Arc/MetJ family transcriptional regulator
VSRVNVNVPDELWERFKMVAEAHFRSRSDHLRFLMDEAVREHEAAVGRNEQPPGDL